MLRVLPIPTPLTESTAIAIPTTVVRHDPSTITQPPIRLSSLGPHQFKSSLAEGQLRSLTGLQIEPVAYSPWLPRAEGRASTNHNSNLLEMAVLLPPTRTPTPLHPVHIGTKTDMGGSLLRDRMVLTGRIQHSTHPTRSCMGNRRISVPTERVAQLVPWSAQGGWECTTTKSSVLMLMMDMVESDEDSGQPFVAGPDIWPVRRFSSSHATMTLCCSSRSLFMFIISICSFPFMSMTIS